MTSSAPAKGGRPLPSPAARSQRDGGGARRGDPAGAVRLPQRSSDLSPEMALRIEIALRPKAEVMIGIQTDYAMARARARLPEITATIRRIARDPDRG